MLPVKADIKNQVEEFFVQRLIIFLAETYRKDVLDACSKNKNPLTDLCDFVQRVRFVSELLQRQDFMPILESANRINNILKKDVETSVNPSYFVNDIEIVLYEKIKQIKDTTYEKLYEGLRETNPSIEKFFEDVLVMDKDKIIRENRLAMLTMLRKSYNLIADFSALQI